ncbi:MAG: CobW family GTP-binding protein [Halioglobus sp.]
MTAERSPVLAVPTNIITGFLGAGKTSAILNLLRHKPDDERWAVLVNEFGEVGVDGSMVQGQNSEDGGVFIREVPGGCMCCAAGLPMQIALTQLLSRARPDRLLIEPTGLGHPLEVLQTLSSDYNRDVMAIHKTLTLVDARNLSAERYTGHDTFRQQLSIADIVIANKDDLCSDADRTKLEAFVGDVCRPGVPIVHARYGEVDPDLLTGATAVITEPPAHIHERETQPLMASDLPFPECGYVTAMNEGEGFESIGWRFSPEKVFDRSRLFAFLSGLDVERMKAVFITSEGVFAYNLTRDALTETELDDCVESRAEIISDRVEPGWGDRLTDCLVG